MKKLVVSLALLAVAAAPARRKLVELFTRVNGTWVGVLEAPAGERSS